MAIARIVYLLLVINMQEVYVHVHLCRENIEYLTLAVKG